MIASASACSTIPCAPSIRAWAIEPAISCRHNRLSNGREAFISRITAAGPSAKRPPHMLFAPSVREIVLRSEIALLLLCGLSLSSAGCDKRSGGGGQGEAANSALAPTPGEAPPAGKPDAAATARVDRRHAGADAPDFIFSGADNKDVSLDDFRGRPLLVNLWATWCGPCVAEMPAIDALAARTKGL